MYALSGFASIWDFDYTFFFKQIFKIVPYALQTVWKLFFKIAESRIKFHLNGILLCQKSNDLEIKC